MIDLKISGRVATVTFRNDNSINTINFNFAKDFKKITKRACSNENVSVVIFRAIGSSFLAGGDINELESSTERVVSDLIDPMHDALKILRSSGKFVISVAHGNVAGAGVSLLLLSDLVFAERDCTLSYAYTKIGLSGDLGITYNISKYLNKKMLFDFVVTGERLHSETALKLGIFSYVLDFNELDGKLNSTVSSLLNHSHDLVKFFKNYIFQDCQEGFEERLDAEKEIFRTLLESKNFKEQIKLSLRK